MTIEIKMPWEKKARAIWSAYEENSEKACTCVLHEDISREFIHSHLSVGRRTLLSGNVSLRRKRKIALISLSTAVAVTIIGILLLAQTSPQVPEPDSSLTLLPKESTNELPSQETPTIEVPSQEVPATEVQDQETPADEIPDIEIPEGLLVVPEVPYGTIAVFVAMLSALLIARKRSKKANL